MALTCLHPSCIPQNEAQPSLLSLHLNGQNRRSGEHHQFLKKSGPSSHIVSQNKIPVRRKYYPPVYLKDVLRTTPTTSERSRSRSSRLYALPPKLPVRNFQVEDGEEKGEGKGELNKADDDVELVSSQDDDSSSQASMNIWQKLAPRYKLILTTAFAFVICNMDKVNMSVAIIPMSHQLGWSSTTSGLVQSSFFWGYAMSQIPGGWLAKAFSGQLVLRVGVLVWSLATAAVPFTAKFLPGLLFCRLLVGLGEGVSPSAATDLIARAMPVSERSRAVAAVFGGLNVGSVVGLLLAPVFIQHFGWESVFYVFGLLGIIWCLLFESAVGASMLGNAGLTSKSKSAKSELQGERSSNGASHIHNGNGNIRQSAQESNGKLHTSTDEKVPWKAFFRSPAVWAMIYAHFCGNWGHYSLLSWLPTYFSDELHLTLTQAALLAIFPPLASVAVSSAAGPLADHLISRGYDITLVRKVCQSLAFLSPALCMAIACLTPKLNPWVDVAILTTGLGLSSFSLAGLYCTHQDISPKYASILLGITNTVGAIPGVLGVALVGIIYDRTHSWNLALFAPSIFFYLTGTVVWNIFASSKPQSFET